VGCVCVVCVFVCVCVLTAAQTVAWRERERTSENRRDKNGTIYSCAFVHTRT